MQRLILGPKADPTRISWEGPKQRPGKNCSYCDQPFGEDDDVPLIVWSRSGWCARFCFACVEEIIVVEDVPPQAPSRRGG